MTGKKVVGARSFYVAKFYTLPRVKPVRTAIVKRAAPKPELLFKIKLCFP